MGRIGLFVVPPLMAVCFLGCAGELRPTTYPVDAPPPRLWVAPDNLEERDLFNGPWGSELAPDPKALYTFVETKHSGVNPGMTVRDPLGREWSVKQAPRPESPNEGPVEVVLSRVLSGVGYLQPPVYYLPSFTLVDDWGTHVEPGGRFRLKQKTLKDRGEWSWRENPFVGTRPHQGLLVILMIFNGSDLKSSNNTLYERRTASGVERWFVVRDIGTALGTTGRFAPLKGDPDAFARHPFIRGVRDGYVEFHYRGWHQDLVRRRITPDDVVWASELLDGLSDRQWQDAFRAGGYAPDVAARFVGTLEQKIAAGRQLRVEPAPASE